MTVPKFDEKELRVVREEPGFLGMGPATPVYDYPVSPKEAQLAVYRREAVWQLLGTEMSFMTPMVNPDNIARAFAFDGNFFPMEKGGGKDMFGIDWVFVPTVGGSMVQPGKPLLENANEWHEKVVWPNLDTWDWEGQAKVNADFLGDEKCNVAMLLNGWFERLVSFMDFGGACEALYDEDQQDAVLELFDKISDLYIDILDRYAHYFPKIDMFNIHDDWGSQNETVFAPELAEKMIVPAMRKVTDHLHAQGRFCDFHSCGQALKQIPNFIKAGWDSWSGQEMNDTQKIYELYGDKIIIGVIPDAFDPETTSEAEQRQAARDFANKFCRPDKPSVLNAFGSPFVTPAFREELYKQSRINYSS